VNEVETLTTDLSRKIWQKIMILHSANQPTSPTAESPPSATTSPTVDGSSDTQQTAWPFASRPWS